MTDRRPHIYARTQLAVRKRCGFGCVLCGNPIYDYEHIVDWVREKQHREQNITLLCPAHHREKTNHLLPVEDVQAANLDPFNLRQGVSTPHYLRYSAPEATANIGGNRMVSSDTFAAVKIDGEQLVGFRFEDGRCMLNLNLFGENNEPVFQVIDNHMTYSVGLWDVNFVGSTLTIRSGRGKIFLELRFEPPGRVFVPRGMLLYNGVEVEIRPDSMLLMNQSILFRNCEARGLPVMYDLGENPRPEQCAFKIEVADRHDFDRAAARRFRRDQLA